MHAILYRTVWGKPYNKSVGISKTEKCGVICVPPGTNESCPTVSVPPPSPKVNSIEQIFDRGDMLPNSKNKPQSLDATESNLHKDTPRSCRYRCRICWDTNILEQHKMKHYVKKHGAGLSNSLDIHFELLDKPILISQCKICKQQINKKKITKHMRKAHSQSLEVSENNIRKSVVRCFTCKICYERNILDQNKKYHYVEKHSTNLVKSLDIHFEFDDKPIRILQCRICKVEIKENRFGRHMRRVHPHALEVKEDRFGGHMRRVHPHALVKTEVPSTTKFAGNPIVLKIGENRLGRHMREVHPHALVKSKVPSPTNYAGNPIVMQHNTKYLPKYRYIYKCRACQILKKKKYYIGDTGLDGINIQEHHKRHREGCIKGNVFTLFKIKIKCSECGQYLMKNKIERHMKRAHQWNYDVNFVKLFKCGGCDVHGISEQNLEAHHKRMHNFPIKSNHFKTCTLKQKVVCDCCGKRYMEGRTKKHHLKACLQRANAIETVMDEHDARSTAVDFAVIEDVEECDENPNAAIEEEILLYLKSTILSPPSQTYLVKKMYETLLYD